MPYGLRSGRSFGQLSDPHRLLHPVVALRVRADGLHPIAGLVRRAGVVVSDEFTQAAADLAAWGQEEGVAVFVIHTTESHGVRYIGPKLPADLVARMLRQAAYGCETQMEEGTLQ